MFWRHSDFEVTCERESTVILILAKKAGATDMNTKTPKPREVEVVRSDYQPTKKELKEDVRVEATFKVAVDALCQSVELRYIDTL